MIIVGIDIGGTFTDLMAFDEASNGFYQAKSLTTPRNLIQGIIDCIDKCALPVAKIDRIIHGSTTAINTLIERKGARTALVATAGHEDALEIGRETRYDSYDLALEKPEPLVPPALRLGLSARTMADGLGQLSAPLFDWQYINAQVIYHYAAFYRYERESIHGRDQKLRDLAAQAFRDVKEHHDAALAIVRDWNWDQS